MMLHLQLLIFFSFLILSMADVRNQVVGDSDVVMTIDLHEANCELSNGLLTSVPPGSPEYKLVEKMKNKSVRRPQCFIKETDTKESKISCYCLKTFLSDCLDMLSMGESLYQWKRDRDSKVAGSTENTISKSVEKVECALKGFYKARKRETATSEIKFKANLTSCSEFHEISQFFYSAPAPKPLAITYPCHPDEVSFDVYCTEEYCFHNEKPLSFYLNTYTRLEDMVNEKKYSELFDGSCVDTKEESLKCVLTGIHHRIANSALFRIPEVVVAPTSPQPGLQPASGIRMISPLAQLTIEEIGNKRLSWNVEDHTDGSLSHGHIFSWAVLCLFTLPFLFVFLTAVFSCSDVYRCELVQHTGPYLKDIETMLAEKQRPNKVASVIKEPKPKSEIVHMTVTTTSQMGNITDLQSEGPAMTGSMKTAKQVKSSEETKEELAM